MSLIAWIGFIRASRLRADSITAIRRFLCCLPGRVNAIDSGRYVRQRQRSAPAAVRSREFLLAPSDLSYSRVGLPHLHQRQSRNPRSAADRPVPAPTGLRDPTAVSTGDDFHYSRPDAVECPTAA